MDLGIIKTIEAYPNWYKIAWAAVVVLVAILIIIALFIGPESKVSSETRNDKNNDSPEIKQQNIEKNDSKRVSQSANIERSSNANVYQAGRDIVVEKKDDK